jgi:hypothetical protein
MIYSSICPFLVACDIVVVVVAVAVVAVVSLVVDVFGVLFSVL